MDNFLKFHKLLPYKVPENNIQFLKLFKALFLDK